METFRNWLDGLFGNRKFLGVNVSTWIFILILFAVILFILRKFFPKIFRMIPFYGKISSFRRRYRRRVRRIYRRFRRFRYRRYRRRRR